MRCSLLDLQERAGDASRHTPARVTQHRRWAEHRFRTACMIEASGAMLSGRCKCVANSCARCAAQPSSGLAKIWLLVRGTVHKAEWIIARPGEPCFNCSCFFVCRVLWVLGEA